jgi:type IV secretory pathway VirB4 component
MTDEKNISPTNTPETGKITITHTEEKGTPQHGIAENLKNKWESILGKDKKLEEKKEKKLESEIGDLDYFFENFDPKKDKKKLTTSMRKRIIEAEKLYQDGVISVKDLIAPSSVELSMYDMKLNGMFVKSYFVFNYPRFLESNWMNQLINFDATLDISIFVYPTDSSQIMKVLRKKVAEMLSTKHMSQKRGVVNDTALDTALEDAEQLRVDLQRGTEKFFQVGIYFTVYGDTKERLEKTCKQLETILGGQLVMTRSTDFRMERGFETTIPQGKDMIEEFRNMNTSPLSTTFPFVSSDLTSNEGILYGLNRHNNSLIVFDRFNLENANQVVFAKSGAGKSYAVKLEILRSLMLGTDVIVIDPENEYESLSRTVGGSYVRVSLTSGQRINPFDLPLPVDEDESEPGELLRENAITLSGLMNIMLGKLNPEEEALMDKAILQTYELKGITADIENPHEYEMPVMADLEGVLNSMEGGKNLATRLEKYTKGTFSGLFSDQTNVDLGSGLVVFCIRDLEEQLRPVSMYILLNFIWNRIRSQLKKRMLVIDEAWHMVQYEDSGRFLHNLTKRARKYYLGITSITQDVEDFLDSKWGKPIITNSSMQLLLRQAPVAMERLQKVFNLTEGEKYLLINSNVGQGLFFAGNQHVAIQIIASYGEHKIITTNPEEILEMKKSEKELAEKALEKKEDEN